MKQPLAYLTTFIIFGLTYSLGSPAMAQDAAQECVTWPRVLPPEGIEIPAEQSSKWKTRIDALDKQLATNRQASYWADVEVLVKACKLAIEFREFYAEKDFEKCDRLLSLAEKRAAWLTGDKGPKPGPLKDPEAGERLQVRGFVSAVDGSAQPVGLIMPEQGLSGSKKIPMFVWLHGRGDKSTDLHFLNERMKSKGEVAPPDALVLHAFGRQCVGYKSAGSTDVIEAIDFVCENYPIDRNKIVLIGFSMGGAGAWHVAACQADRFVAASPGAGFAETKLYQNLTPDKYPAPFVQTLWGVYDVPDYTRNLFNLPVIAYSGENDKQIQAARVMEKAFQSEGRQLEHLIGPGMGHKYHPDVLKDLIGKLSAAAKAGRPADPTELHLQTKHLRVHERRWISVEGQLEQYADTRVDATRKDSQWQLTTKNVSRLKLEPPVGAKLTVDGQAIAGKSPLLLVRQADKWQAVDKFDSGIKRPGLSGPIDDAFFDPFLFVTPSGKSTNSNVAKWAQCEQAYAITRWKSLMRGEPRVKRDVDVTADDMAKYHIVVWGDSESNQLLARLMKAKLPVAWDNSSVRVGQETWSADKHVPVAILPNPESPNRYLVINSGLTFRDAHDKTNSLQNPQLPDWAVIDITTPRSASAPGKITAAGFFSDQWK